MKRKEYTILQIKIQVGGPLQPVPHLQIFLHPRLPALTLVLKYFKYSNIQLSKIQILSTFKCCYNLAFQPSLW